MPDPEETQPAAPAAPAPTKKGAMPVLRAHGPWADSFGFGVRVDAGETLDWSDERVQRLFRQQLGWSAFAVEFVDLPAGRAKAAESLADAAARIAELEGQVKAAAERLETAKDDAVKAVAQEMADLTEHVAKLQALADERAAQVAEVQQKLASAIAGEPPKA